MMCNMIKANEILDDVDVDWDGRGKKERKKRWIGLLLPNLFWLHSTEAAADENVCLIIVHFRPWMVHLFNGTRTEGRDQLTQLWCDVSECVIRDSRDSRDSRYSREVGVRWNVTFWRDDLSLFWGFFLTFYPLGLDVFHLPSGAVADAASCFCASLARP